MCDNFLINVDGLKIRLGAFYLTVQLAAKEKLLRSSETSSVPYRRPLRMGRRHTGS